MNTTLTLKIINDQTVLDSLPKEKKLSEAQQGFIRSIVKMAVEEYIKQDVRQQFPSTNIDRILRLPEAEAITGLSRATIYRHMHQGSFPISISLGGRSVGWKESQIKGWLKQRELAPKEF